MRFLLLALAAFSAVAHGATAADSAPRPNIVFVMADDMGWGQTGISINLMLAE